MPYIVGAACHLAIAGQRILGEEKPDGAWATGKEWVAHCRSTH
jgi:hypothetical protein